MEKKLDNLKLELAKQAALLRLINRKLTIVLWILGLLTIPGLMLLYGLLNG